MKLVYDVKDKPRFGKLIVFAFQQLLAIMAATIAVPNIVGNGMTLCRNVRRRRGHNSVSAVYKIPQPCFSRLFLCVYRLHVLGLAGGVSNAAGFPRPYYRRSLCRPLYM